MAVVLDDLKSAFLAHGVKTVTTTDKNKAAYVLTKQQMKVLKLAGATADHSATLDVRVLTSEKHLASSYYNSERVGSGRGPEPRMGRALINWLEVGDTLLLATDGHSIFAHKISSLDRQQRPEEEVDATVQRALAKVDPQHLLRRAKKVIGPPKKTTATVTVFARDAAVKAYVLKRSDRTCEVCGWKGFRKDDGTQYIQVHHVTWLSKEGEDTIENTVALCPNCHARAHFSSERATFAQELRTKVTAANAAYAASLS